jgi:hypothetical protein
MVQDWGNDHPRLVPRARLVGGHLNLNAAPRGTRHLKLQVETAGLDASRNARDLSNLGACQRDDAPRFRDGRVEFVGEALELATKQHVDIRGGPRAKAKAQLQIGPTLQQQFGCAIVMARPLQHGNQDARRD